MQGITYEIFTNEANAFMEISDKIGDGWTLHEAAITSEIYLKKVAFVDNKESILKAEYVVYYSQSYNVPMFAFNLWNESGVLLTLDQIRQISLIEINKDDFYSVITQQEHPFFFRPFFVVHPCHTGSMLSIHKDTSKNLLVTFLSFVAPLIKLRLPLEYAF